MGRCVISEADAILDKEYRVLDKGFVRLVDYLGSDARIVQAARVSYGEGTKTFRQDKGLITYLLRNDHTSPFEQVNFTFHIKMPIFVARQWVRHRTARMNEISGRYSVMEDEAYLPALENINAQSEDNKQARSQEPLDEKLQREVATILAEDQKRAFETYHKLLDLGIARELARINLPLSLYTEIYWQMDLHNLFHFIKLRLDPHAQYEIRVYAEVILSIIKSVCPIACEAFENYVLNAKRFNAKEIGAINALINQEESPLSGREQQLFEEKLT